jgi:hypothetical protein
MLVVSGVPYQQNELSHIKSSNIENTARGDIQVKGLLDLKLLHSG